MTAIIIILTAIIIILLVNKRLEKAKARNNYSDLEAKVTESTAKLLFVNEQLRQRNLETSILYKVSSVISQSIQMDKLLADVLNTIAALELFKIDKGSIFVVEGDRMRMAAQLGHSSAFIDFHKDMRVGDCLCGIVAKTGEILISQNSAKDKRHTIKDPFTTSHGHLIIPLKTRDRIEGVLDLYMPVDAEIDEDKRKLMLSIGNQLGIAIENSRLYEETKELSLHDPLTGLWNHAEILRILKRELARAEREGGCITAFMADIDHFKKINDTYGHQAGDEVLGLTAGRILSVVRPYDSIGRYGGEEFLVILPGCDKPHIAATSERFRSCIGGERMDTRGGMIQVTISIGVAMTGRGKRCDVDSLVRAADSALYRAKNNGRNRVEVAFEENEKG